MIREKEMSRVILDWWERELRKLRSAPPSRRNHANIREAQHHIAELRKEVA